MAETPYAFLVGGAFNTVVGPTLASASTISPTFGVHHVSGTTTINTITVPWSGFTGQITLIPDGAWALGTTGNIKSALQSVVNVPVVLEFDGTSWFNAAPYGPITLFDPFPNVSYAASVLGIGTFQIAPVTFQAQAAFASIDFFVSNSYSATNAGSSRADTVSASVGVYTRTGSSLSLASSATATTAFTVTGSSSSGSYQGLKSWPIALAVAATPGNYWVAFASSQATAGNAIAGALSNVVASYAGGQSAYLGVFGSASAISEQAVLGMGSYSVTSASIPAVIGFSEILGSALGNTAQPIFHFKNYSA